MPDPKKIDSLSLCTTSSTSEEKETSRMDNNGSISGSVSEESCNVLKESQFKQSSLNESIEMDNVSTICESVSEENCISLNESRLKKSSLNEIIENRGSSNCESSLKENCNPSEESQSQKSPLTKDINSSICGADSTEFQSSQNNCEKENSVSSKVVVQMLPSIDLGSISALVELNALKSLSAKSSEADSLKSDKGLLSSSEIWSPWRSAVGFENVSEVNVIGRTPEFKRTCFPNRSRQVCKRSLKKRKAFNGFTGTYSIHPGIGMKLVDIKHISAELEKSSAQVIRILHYLLFEVYGLVANETSLQRTVQNILQFSGFSFAEDSVMYNKKKKALVNLPYPLLICVHKILMNSPPVTRSSAVETLLQFLQKPTDMYFCKEMPGKLQKEMSEREIEKLKTQALEAHPVVILKRLKGNLSDEARPKKNKERTSLEEYKTFTENYVKPSFIRCGTGSHLKRFPDIVNNIRRARRRIVNLLHSLLYGRPGSDTINRQNILEFNGFASSRVPHRMAFLKRLRVEDLTQLCNVLSLKFKTRNKNKKIVKLLHFLGRPHKLNAQKIRGKLTVTKQSCMNDDNKSKNIDQYQNEIDIGEKIPDEKIIKLRDFDAICSKVECATPDSLSELSDLLFIKPCDSSEIHQKILDFTSFSFNNNSFEFHCRKTLMHYMDMKTIRKVADLLDIEDWENCRSHQELTQNILKFLMNMKLPEKKGKTKASDGKNKRKRYPNIMKLNSSKNFSQSRSDSSENCDSTYASEEMNENEWDLNQAAPNAYYNNIATHTYHQSKNGFSKQDHTHMDSTSLFELVQHPTDRELHHQIDKIISTAPLSITLGELVKEVLKFYPKFNLQYRIDFIRSTALKILQEMRESILIFPE